MPFPLYSIQPCIASSPGCNTSIPLFVHVSWFWPEKILKRGVGFDVWFKHIIRPHIKENAIEGGVVHPFLARFLHSASGQC